MTQVLVETGVDAGLVWHHGNPVAEARSLSQGVVALRNREIVEITGPDRLSWLHALTTQHLSELKPGEGFEALILSPQGHIEQVLCGVDDGERVLAWTEPGRAEGLLDYLTRMRFATRVELARREDLIVVWCGDQVMIPQASVSRPSLGGRELFWPADQPLPEGVSVGTWAFDAHRISAGQPRIFVDTDARTIPNEIALFGTHLQKGCYRGQETVARIYNLGRPPRRLVLLHLDGSAEALPAVGESLELAGRQVGFVGSSARHHELGPIALGLVKRAIPVDATLTVAGIAAAQEPLVDPEVGRHFRPDFRQRRGETG